MQLRSYTLFLLGVVVCLLVAWGLVALVGGPRDSGSDGRSVAVATGQADLGGPFTLIDHTGRRVTEEDFRGRHMLVFFGFTYCPDVCPMELQTIAEALDLMGEGAERIAPLFITVDPERDTVDAIGSYVKAFHPRIIGLTGTVEEIAAAAKAYKVYYREAPGTRPGDQDYLVDHTTFIYLMGPDGGFQALFRHGTPADALAEELSKHVG